ncbi:MAG TPA: hypothetical protein VHE99_06615 [Gammaproteobacteria bacterium]|nr:hypothetical protein [Gammaproteobacteria bacterium]
MKLPIYTYSDEKNLKLLETRGISFEDIITILDTKGCLAVIDHPNLNIRKKNTDVKLDLEEQEIEDNLPDTWEQLPFSANQAEELAFAKQAAANYLRKGAKINIRLTQHDIEGLKRIATREGLPYQTLISSILHKYVTHYLER